MTDKNVPFGIDEQVQSALVAAQLDYGRAGEIREAIEKLLAQLQNIANAPLPTVSAKSRIPGGQLVHRLSARLVRRHLAAQHEQTRQLATQSAAILSLVGSVLDEQSFAAVDRVRKLQNSIMDRIAVVDALVAKVAMLEQRQRVD